MYSTKLKPFEKIDVTIGNEVITIRSHKVGGRQVRVLIDSPQKAIIKKLDDPDSKSDNFNSEEGSNSWEYRNR